MCCADVQVPQLLAGPSRWGPEAPLRVADLRQAVQGQDVEVGAIQQLLWMDAKSISHHEMKAWLKPERMFSPFFPVFTGKSSFKGFLDGAEFSSTGGKGVSLVPWYLRRVLCPVTSQKPS